MPNDLNYLHDTRNTSVGGNASFGATMSTASLGVLTLNSQPFRAGVFHQMQTRMGTVARSVTTQIDTSFLPPNPPLPYNISHSFTVRYVKAFAYIDGGGGTNSILISHDNDAVIPAIIDGIGAGSGMSFQGLTTTKPVGFNLSFSSTHRIKYKVGSTDIENNFVVKPTEMGFRANFNGVGESIDYEVYGYQNTTKGNFYKPFLIGSGRLNFLGGSPTYYIPLNSTKFFSSIEFKGITKVGSINFNQVEVYGLYKTVKFNGL